MVYKAIDIAQYVVNYAIDTDRRISNLKLQKILYYIQAAFLVEKNEPCFEDNIVNWKHGPVIETVYDNYKKYSNRNITDYQIGYTKYHFDEEYNLVEDIITFDPNFICENDRELIERVSDSLLGYDAWALVDKTHEETPWKSTNRFDVITNCSIKEYFENNNKETRIFGE